MEHRPRPHLGLAFGALLFLAGAIIATSSFWLPAIGYALVRSDGPAKAEIAVVLGGDFYGRRILKGAELVREGYIPAVLVSGPPGFYGMHECDLAIPFAAER